MGLILRILGIILIACGVLVVITTPRPIKRVTYCFKLEEKEVLNGIEYVLNAIIAGTYIGLGLCLLLYIV